MEQGLQVARTAGDDSRHRARRLGGDRRAAAARARLLQGERGRVLRARRRALRADQRPRGLVRRGVRPGQATTCATSAWTAIRSAEVTDDRFEPRPEVDPAADVEGWPRTGEVPASRTARVWISPERARWAREQRQVAQELRRRLGRRRAELRRQRLARARGAQGGRRRRRARARRTRARRCSRPSRSCAPRPSPGASRSLASSVSRVPSRRDAIQLSDDEVVAFLDEQRT